MRRPAPVVALLLCACLAACASASAAAPRGTLTPTEFQQLKTVQTRTNALGSGSQSVLTRSRRICARMRQSTGLLHALRADCLALDGFGLAGLKADAAANRCTIHGPTVAKMERCMLPSFRAYHSSARAYYLADRHVDHVAQGRGFSSRCVAVLGDPQRTLTAESKLVNDLAGVVSALFHSNPDGLQKAAKRVASDDGALRSGSGSLALCPHQ